jgi:hypothetical protein
VRFDNERRVLAPRSAPRRLRACCVRGIRSPGFHTGAFELGVGIARQGAPIIDVAMDGRSFSEVEMPLDGGRSTPDVVRVGETVRRPMNANSGYVHGLLLHLEHCGFTGAPRYLGVDRQGREILTYIHGFAPPHNGFELTEAAVRAGARLVRDVHDLTEATVFAAGSEVACHRNLSRPNFIFRETIPVAIIDWDTTCPGSRVANLGEFLWAFVHPALYGDGEPAVRMLRAAVDEYGYQGPGLVEAMLAPIRTWVRDDPDPGKWALDEFEYMERNAPLFHAGLAATSP